MGEIEEAAMNPTGTLPITITPEAAARIAELGMQAELDQMVEQARRVVPQLTRIWVELAERYDTGGEPGVTICAGTRLGGEEVGPLDWDLTRWYVNAFPPQVREHLLISLYPGEGEYAG
jgi:hypothetical protein